jgi:hypothetical protein
MTVRAPGKIAITVPLVFLMAAVALVLLISHGVTFEGSHHSGIGTAGPAAATAMHRSGSRAQQPATSQGSNQATGSSSNGASSQPPSNVAAPSNGSVKVGGGPEDAGPGVVNQQASATSCQPRPCRR